MRRCHDVAACKHKQTSTQHASTNKHARRVPRAELTSGLMEVLRCCYSEKAVFVTIPVARSATCCARRERKQPLSERCLHIRQDVWPAQPECAPREHARTQPMSRRAIAVASRKTTPRSVARSLRGEIPDAPLRRLRRAWTAQGQGMHTVVRFRGFHRWSVGTSRRSKRCRIEEHGLEDGHCGVPARDRRDHGRLGRSPRPKPGTRRVAAWHAGARCVARETTRSKQQAASNQSAASVPPCYYGA